MNRLTRTFGTLTALVAFTAPVGVLGGASATAAGSAPQIEGGPGQAPPRRAPAQRPARPLPPEVTENFTRTVRLGSRDGFELSTGFGQITITGAGGTDDVRIDVVKRTRDANRDAGRALLQSVSIRITDRGGVVEALTEFTKAGSPVFVDYNVTLPSRASVLVKAFGGPVRVSNVRGELRIEAANGDITLSDVGPIRRAMTVVGDLTITNVDGEEVNASTTAGTLLVRNARTRTLELATVGGALTVIDGRCEQRCTLKTINGDIEFVGPLTRGGRYDLQSQKGNIRLAPTGPVNFDLEARTFVGRPQSDYPLKTASAREGLLRGSYGDEGGAIVSITSWSGNVAVIRK